MSNNSITYSMEMNKIYNLLQDEESKFIYRQCIKAFLYGWDNPISEARIDLLQGVVKYALEKAKDIKYTDNVLSHSFVQCILDFRKKYSNLYLFGAGAFGQALARVLLLNGIDITAFIDNDENKHGKIIMDKPILSPSILDKDCADSAVLISSFLYETEIYNQLFKMGMFHNDLVSVYNAGSLYEIAYFSPDFLLPVDGGTYFDIGCYNGQTLINYANWCQRNNTKYSKLIGFEANVNRLPIIYSDTKHLANVEVIPYAAYSKECTLEFILGKNEQVNCLHQKNDDTMVVKIKTKKIDDVADELVSYIKMDIEGAEYEALLGAQNTIKKYKPTLAISIYHRESDIVKIPTLLSEWVPEYKFYIRHYSTHIYETVLYAVK